MIAFQGILSNHNALRANFEADDWESTGGSRRDRAPPQAESMIGKTGSSGGKGPFFQSPLSADNSGLFKGKAKSGFKSRLSSSLHSQKEKTFEKTQKANVYDIIDSGELRRLYQKNTQLLSRLSSTGRQNGILQSELCSLIEQKSKLGEKNNFLENKVMGLREKLSLFSTRQKQFNEQSRRLKREVENLKFIQSRKTGERIHHFKTQSQTASKKLIQYVRYRRKVNQAHKEIKKLLEERQKKIILFEKKELVYRMQISALQKRQAQRESEAKAGRRQREKAFKDLLARQKEQILKEKTSLETALKKALENSRESKAKQEKKAETQRLQLQNKIAEAESALQGQKNRAETLAKELASARKALEEARHENSKSAAEAESALQEQKNRAETLAKELASARKALEEAKHKNSKSAAEAESALQEQKNRAEALAKELASARKALEEAKHENSKSAAEAESALQEQKNRAETLAKELASVRKALEEAKHKNSKSAAEAKSALQEQKNRAEALAKELDSVRKALEEARHKNSKSATEAESALQRQKNRAETLAKELASVRKALEEARHKNSKSAHKKQAKELKSINEALEKTKQAMEKSLQSLKSQKEQILREKTALISKAEANRGEMEKIRALSEKRAKESEFLSAHCASLRKALSRQEEGFQSAMISFRRKYLNSYQKLETLETSLKDSRKEAKTLKSQLLGERESFEREKQSLIEVLEKKAESRAQSFLKELSAAKEENESLKSQVQHTRDKRFAEAREREKSFEEEIKILKLRLQSDEAKSQEEREREKQSLKNEYENRANNLNLSYTRKLRHIRTEMENDLCAEKRRAEIFQSMKEKQLKETDSALGLAQKEAHKLKTANFALENSQKELLEKLKKEIAASQSLMGQNQNLQSLWHDLQKKSEEKDQKIQSLQSLNKSLSLSLSRGQNQLPPDGGILSPANQKLAAPFEKAEESAAFSAHQISDEPPASEAAEEKPKTGAGGELGSVCGINRALADIHFE